MNYYDDGYRDEKAPAPMTTIPTRASVVADILGCDVCQCGGYTEAIHGHEAEAILAAREEAIVRALQRESGCLACNRPDLTGTHNMLCEWLRTFATALGLIK